MPTFGGQVLYTIDFMRRIISIFLLFTMLVTGAQPVLAMHFCEGKLYSVNLSNNEQDCSCCKEATCEMMTKVPEGSYGNPFQFHKGASSVYSSMKDNCCDFNRVKLSTDDFNNHLQQFNFNNIQPSFENVWLVLYSDLNSPEFESPVTVRHTFPPGGLNKLHVDLLAYICIYRI